jgi:glycosyltransferase involved in cell wall biosynthesis
MKYWIPFFAPGYAVVAWLLRRSTPIRVLYILDNVVPHEKSPFGHLLTRWALRRADGFVAQSDQVRRDLDRIVPGIDPGRVLTAPHPVYDFTAPGQTQKTQGAARTALGLSPDARLVLYFGFIKPYKGVMHLIDAVPRLRERYGREIQVLIVGDIYGDRRPYHDRIDALGVEQNLKLVDSFVPDDEIQDYFLAADLVVLPYVSATQSGIVQIAYNYEKPVVTTNVGGLPEVVLCEKTGFLVPPGDPGALAAAVIRFFDEGWAGRMAAEIAREKDKYSWDRTVVAIENLAAGGR